jgi:TatD DNase family protein
LFRPSERFNRVLALAAQHAALYAALGCIRSSLKSMMRAWRSWKVSPAPPKLVAVGEIGLDLYRDDPQFERQQRCWRRS